VPHHVDAKPFWYTTATKRSISGEDIVWDSNDDIVWFTQGGALGQQTEYNHSRVLSYDPGTGGAGGGPGGGTFKSYNLPGNRNEAVGLYWDQARNWVWVAEFGAYSTAYPVVPPAKGHQGSIIAFNPDVAAHDIDWRWELEADADLSDQLCWGSAGAGGAGGGGGGGGGGWSEPDHGCYKRYDLPTGAFDEDSPPNIGAFAPAHLVGDPGGFIWFTAYWGSMIGRLDPDTEAVQMYPLQATRGTGQFSDSGPTPWEIAISPDGLYVVWSEFLDVGLARMLISRWNDPACHTLDGDGLNPCVEEMLIPDVDLTNQAVHSISFDPDGRLWFGENTFYGKGIVNKIGFVDAAWTCVTKLEDSGADEDGRERA